MIRKKKVLGNSRSGQIRMSETIAVLFIFFVLVLFGILFYYQYQKVAIKEQAREELASRAIDATLKTLFLPELLCTKGEAEPEDNCLDMMKLRHANKTFTDNLNKYYFNVFRYAKISVKEVYPSSEEDTQVIYEVLPRDTEGKENWEKSEATFFVVTLRDFDQPTNEISYGLGYIKVEVYS